MAVTDAQVRKLMDELSRHGKKGLAALRSGMDRKTAAKYAKEGKVPSELTQPRTWRTRQDAFEEDWPGITDRLSDAPELEAKALFEDLARRKADRYAEGQLRTFQRRVRKWRALHGPDKEVFFTQQHRPGEAMQTDFTHVVPLAMTIVGEPAPPLLCQCVLPYSNWQWATPCHSESLLALRRGVQGALFRLGRVPKFHQTDNSTAATHDLGGGKRAFNKDYEALMAHLGPKPRTIGVGKSNQNGDVEALHGALKRRLEQHLLLRGGRDFESLQAYESWLSGVCVQANGLRTKRVAEEMAVMRPLAVSRLPEFVEERVPVSSSSTIRIRRNIYSVPSRLIKEQVRVRIFEDRLEVYFASQLQLVTRRLPGHGGHRINYRHVIWSLVRKPGAFDCYRYREELFPSLVFRKAYDVLSEACASTRKADIEYLRVLHLAASTLQADVETALVLLLEQGQTPRADAVKAIVAPARPEVPELDEPKVDLSGYDCLLPGIAEEACR